MHGFDTNIEGMAEIGLPLEAESTGDFADLTAAARQHELFPSFKDRLRSEGCSVLDLPQTELCALFLMYMHQQAGISDFNPGERYG